MHVSGFDRRQIFRVQVAHVGACNRAEGGPGARLTAHDVYFLPSPQRGHKLGEAKQIPGQAEDKNKKTKNKAGREGRRLNRYLSDTLKKISTRLVDMFADTLWRPRSP